MKNTFFKLVMAALIFTAASSQAGPAMLNVKLVKLTSNGRITPGLENVAAIIQRNLPYAGCELIEQKACVLPANATLSFKIGYSLICKSTEDSVGVTILKKNKLLISTIVTLKGATPVIIGGFDGGTTGTKHVFVLQKGE